MQNVGDVMMQEGWMNVSELRQLFILPFIDINSIIMLAQKKGQQN